MWIVHSTRKKNNTALIICLTYPSERVTTSDWTKIDIMNLVPTMCKVHNHLRPLYKRKHYCHSKVPDFFIKRKG